MKLQEFKNKIKTKDVEGNKTYLYLTVNGCMYGQYYQNQTSTLEDMKNRFVMTYYPMAIECKHEQTTEGVNVVCAKCSQFPTI